MKIFGIGTDIVNIKRMDNSLKKNGDIFKNRVFSKKEIAYCEKKKILVLFTLSDLLLKRHLVKHWAQELEKVLT